MEYINIIDKGWPPEYAQTAYNEGYFVEAIQVLHGWLECQCRGLLFMTGSHHFGTSGEESWDIADEIPFKDTVKCLFVLGQISKDQYNDLQSLNSLRNRMVHQLFKDPWEKEFKGIPKSQYDNVFQKTGAFCDLILEKLDSFN